MPIAFRRFADPFVIPVAPTPGAQFTIVGDPRFPPDGRNSSFIITNPNQFCVRLKGSNQRRDGGFVQVTEENGWLFLPMSQTVWTTQYPDWVSAMSVTRGGLVAGNGTLELAYGEGI